VDHPATPDFLDDTGRPLAAHIQGVLRDLAPRLRRRFPALNDPAVITDVLEEAGRRIADHESRSGPIEKLHGYAWVTVRSVAMSKLRGSAMRVVRATLDSDAAQSALARVASDIGNPEDIERAILLDEILARLPPDERMVCVWKKAGFTSKDIGERLGLSASAVDTLFYRIRTKVQKMLQAGSHRREALKADVRSKPASGAKANG
jgi:RNA polymerase sigma factor (sigma-70 family)